MEFIKDIFVWENVKNLDVVVYSLRQKIAMPFLYCIVCQKEKKRIEIISSMQLFSNTNLKRYENQYKVIGVAYGKYEIIELLKMALQEYAKQNADFNELGKWFLEE